MPRSGKKGVKLLRIEPDLSNSSADNNSCRKKIPSIEEVMEIMHVFPNCTYPEAIRKYDEGYRVFPLSLDDKTARSSADYSRKEVIVKLRRR